MSDTRKRAEIDVSDEQETKFMQLFVQMQLDADAEGIPREAQYVLLFDAINIMAHAMNQPVRTTVELLKRSRFEIDAHLNRQTGPKAPRH
jgi:hypothetical protein